MKKMNEKKLPLLDLPLTVSPFSVTVTTTLKMSFGKLALINRAVGEDIPREQILVGVHNGDPREHILIRTCSNQNMF